MFSFLLILFCCCSLSFMFSWFNEHSDYHRYLTRRHFSRPSFYVEADKDGIVRIKSGPDPDHATRCQNYLKDDTTIVEYLVGKFCMCVFVTVLLFVLIHL